MIVFNYETDIRIDEVGVRKWIELCIEGEAYECGEINYIFCDDSYLHKLNVEFLNHDTLTDIISFDYSMGTLISGDIFISVERVLENAEKFSQTPDNEINRVMIHGILHFIGYRDKSEEEKNIMRNKEDECLLLLTKI